MDSSNYLSTLMNTGADAFSNLWEMSLTDSSLSSYTARVTNATIPIQERKVIEIPYMNTKGYKKTPFVDLDKKVTFNIRVDENYEVYKKLLDSLNAKPYDTVDSKEPSTFTLTFTCKTAKEMAPHTYTFKKCSVISVGKTLQYSYDSPRPITVPVTVIYESKEEDGNSASVKTSPTPTPSSNEPTKSSSELAREDYYRLYGV